jgi:hypothetical protein
MTATTAMIRPRKHQRSRVAAMLQRRLAPGVLVVKVRDPTMTVAMERTRSTICLKRRPLGLVRD